MSFTSHKIRATESGMCYIKEDKELGEKMLNFSVKAPMERLKYNVICHLKFSERKKWIWLSVSQLAGETESNLLYIKLITENKYIWQWQCCQN